MTVRERLAHWLVTPVLNTVASGFEAGSRFITRLKNFMPSNSEINDQILADGSLMRARARKLAQENPWAGGAIDSVVANTIGTGIRPHSQHTDEAMRERINKAFKKLVPSIDASGMCDFWGLQTLVTRAVRTDGEVFVRVRYRRPSDGIPFSFQLQVLEADYCPLERNTPPMDGQPFSTRAGIVMDPLGRRRSYWMYKEHPASSLSTGELNEIPAQFIFHIFEMRRPGQIRGYPWLTPAIVMLYDLKQLYDASLLRVKIANLLAVFIKRPTPQKTGVFGEKAATTTVETPKGKLEQPGVAEAELKPGSVTYINEGEEVDIVNPNADGIEFKAFLRSMLEAVARALGVTFEQLTGNLEGVTYSSIRAGLLEFRRWCEAWQYNVIIHQFCRQVWRVFIEQAILSGEFGPNAIASYNADPEPWLACRWDPPGWPWVDPLKDSMAARAAIRDGLSSRSIEAAYLGFDSEELDAQQAEDNQRADDLGLTYDSDARKQEGAGDPNAQAALDREAVTSGKG